MGGQRHNPVTKWPLCAFTASISGKVDFGRMLILEAITHQSFLLPWVMQSEPITPDKACSVSQAWGQIFHPTENNLPVHVPLNLENCHEVPIHRVVPHPPRVWWSSEPVQWVLSKLLPLQTLPLASPTILELWPPWQQDLGYSFCDICSHKSGMWGIYIPHTTYFSENI